MLDHSEDVEAELHELQRQGHAIGVDDFGTGYSSLSYMKRLPLKTIKIDRSFIQNIPHDLNDVAISRTIISLSHDLGYEVVAEGVETAEQLEFLLDKGCNYAQGYFFGKPVPAEEFAGLVDDINHRLHVHAGWPARLRSIK
jgi:EAL domain-containing protein (putative c-di-GMP-specific phosphodiesterase class I)